MITPENMAALQSQVALNLECYARRGASGVCVCIMSANAGDTEVSILTRGAMTPYDYRAGIEHLQERVDPSGVRS